MNRRAALLVAMLLSGCATSENHIYPGLFGQKVVGNAVSVTVSNVWNQQDAFPLADKHCAQYQKAARFISMDGRTASFDCLNP